MEKEIIKLDYSLESPEERKALVQKILSETPNPSSQYLESLADYLVFCMEKKEKKEKKLLTENRLVTVRKRETSFEGLFTEFLDAEECVYHLINDNKHALLQPKVSITKKDIEEVPFMRQLREAIAYWEERLPHTRGRNAYIIKSTIIELRKDQYVLKNAYRKPIVPAKITKSQNYATLDEKIAVKDDDSTVSIGVSLLNPKIIQVILGNYSRFRAEAWGNFEKDLWYLLEDFDNVSTKALENYPMYEALVTYKIDGLTNLEIQERLENEFHVRHSIEYLSSLWRNKIPKLIASAAEDQYLEWYYLNIAPGKYKRCSKCGQYKLALNKYFSKNKTSKDGLYSMCKECRNKKKG